MRESARVVQSPWHVATARGGGAVGVESGDSSITFGHRTPRTPRVWLLTMAAVLTGHCAEERGRRVSGNYRRDDAFAGERSGRWNVLDGCFAGLGLLMLGVWDPGAVPQLLRGVVVFDCANSNYRKHAKGSVSVGLGVTGHGCQVASSFTARGREGRPRLAPRARPGRGCIRT